MDITFTGNKQANMLILQQLDDKSLSDACQTNKNLRELCNREDFWMNRIIDRFGKDSLLAKRGDETYQSFYKKKRYFVVPLCRLLNRYMMFNLMSFDFYNPIDGFLNQKIIRSVSLISYLLTKLSIKSQGRRGEDVKSFKEALDMQYGLIPEYNRHLISKSYSFTDLDRETFLKIINYNMTKGQMLEITLSQFPKLAKKINSLLPVNEAIKFLIYVHDGFRNDILPLDIVLDEFCQNRYILDFEF